ncbi:MAG: hypothetical protein WKF66_20395 [Pedobacter sp.]
MNNTFDINRFGLLLRRQWLEFGKIYLITLGVAFGVIVCFYLFCLWPIFAYGHDTGSRLSFREPLFVIFGLLFITVVASNYFAHLGQKSRTIIDLLVPSSTFEKMVAAILFSVIIVTLSFIVIFFLTDLAFVTKLRSLGELKSAVTIDNVPRVDYKVVEFAYLFRSWEGFKYAPFYFAPILTSSIFLLGSVYFNKFNYIKTAISLMLFSGVAGYIFGKSSEFLTRDRIPTDPNGFIIGREAGLIEYLLLSVFMLLTIIFWVITYVRLKEKEV